MKRIKRLAQNSGSSGGKTARSHRAVTRPTYKPKRWHERLSASCSGWAIVLSLSLIVLWRAWKLVDSSNDSPDHFHIYSNDITVFAGTRPEVIKLAPVVEGLTLLGISSRVISTGQHSTMLTETAGSLGFDFTDKLRWKRKSSNLKDLFKHIFTASYDYMLKHRPRMVVIQGDTTTALAVGLAAAHLLVDVAHVEAGLRTYDTRNPFPEEMNRVQLDHLSSLLFAPSKIAESNLLDEGICAERVFMVGNTVVDSLLQMQETGSWSAPKTSQDIIEKLSNYESLVLVTCHRRESYGEKMEAIFAGINSAADYCLNKNSCAFIFPVHKSPVVRKTAEKAFMSNPNVLLVPPMDYGELVYLYQAVDLIVTDSGGIQEEATALGIQTIVVREHTERPEGVLAGILDLVPVNASVISSTILGKIRIGSRKSTNTTNISAIYGVGDSGLKIAKKLLEYINGRQIGKPTQGCDPRVLQSKSVSNSLFSKRLVPPANRPIRRSPAQPFSALMAMPSKYSEGTKSHHNITVIVSFYRRVNTVDRILDSLLQQKHSPEEVWAYVFGSPIQSILVNRLRRYQSDNPRIAQRLEIFEATKSLGYHGRFQLGLQVRTPYVAIFDDDCIPGSQFLAHTLYIMNIGKYMGVFGIKGHDAGPYLPDQPIFGAGPLAKSQSLEEVDIVGGAWIMKSDHLKLLFRRKPYTWTTGEDMQLCHAMRTIANYSCYVLPANYSDPNSMGTSDLEDYLKISEEGDTTYVTVTAEERVNQEVEFFLAGDRRDRWMQLIRSTSNCKFLMIARNSDALEQYALEVLPKLGSIKSCSNVLWFSAVTDSHSYRDLTKWFGISGKLDIHRDFDHDNKVLAITLVIEKLHTMLEMVQPAAILADSRSLRPEELQGILTAALIEQQCAILMWCSSLRSGWPTSIPRYLKQPGILVWCPVGESSSNDLKMHLQACLTSIGIGS